MLRFQNNETALKWLLPELGAKMRVATPLGLGKPNLFLNALVERIESDTSLSMKLYTALSLSPPNPKADLEKRFFTEFRNRHWGEHYPELRYVTHPHPAIQVHEFYFQAGGALTSDRLQQNYQSINYTHVTRRIFESDVQVVIQAVARREIDGEVQYSLSCNPDLTLDLKDLYEAQSKRLLIVGVVHPDLPFLGGEAAVDETFFSAIVDDSANQHTLFALPRIPIDSIDHTIGIYASQLILDDGTLQVGIGSLSDAIVHSLLIRHQNPAVYEKLATDFNIRTEESPQLAVSTAPFETGLYGLSEMITDGFMYLRDAGILKREIRDEVSGRSTYLHGAFFLGSKTFYQWLRDLSPENFSGLRMSRISKINDLYDPNEVLLRRQRKNARFMNTCMQVTLLGSAASETLEDGKVVSGVGGQYNFVSMAHELPDARSILMLRATRTKKGKRDSNLVWKHGQATIPRHLRDIVITEYGVADVRNKSDSETIAALINIADSEFQEELLVTAKKNKKIASDYQIPGWAKNNHPARIEDQLRAYRTSGFFKAFPFGSDFTPEEEKLALALGSLAPLGPRGLIERLIKVPSSTIDSNRALQRMNLLKPRGFKERLYHRLLRSALARIDSAIL